jgi:hypothetical protein
MGFEYSSSGLSTAISRQLSAFSFQLSAFPGGSWAQPQPFAIGSGDSRKEDLEAGT